MTITIYRERELGNASVASVIQIWYADLTKYEPLQLHKTLLKNELHSPDVGFYCR